MLRTGLGIAASILMTGSAWAGERLRLPDMPLHDPWIVADTQSRTYYLYTSNDPRMTGDCVTGTMVYESHDLKTWSRPKIVYRLQPGGWANGGGWAPEVHAWGGHYYLFTTVHNETLPITDPAPKPNRHPYRRGTIMARSDTLEGPFAAANNGEPVADAGRMTLDGTLYVDPTGKPWFVFAHEWLQQTDGTIEALPLDADLKPSGPAMVLFKASDAAWAKGNPQPEGDKTYVTDGPELYRTKDGHLLMLWSSWGTDGYVQSIARSDSGAINGPWTQLNPLVRQDSGHGMLFRAFDGKLMMVLHRPFKNARGKLYEMHDAGDHLEVVKERTDLDGDGTAAAPLERPNCRK